MASSIDLEQGIPRRSSDSVEETRRSSDEEVVSEEGRKSSSSASFSSPSSSCLYESSAEEVVVDLEVKESVHSSKVERDCRICHLSLLDGSNPESGLCIELGCSCKGDLAAAHKHCAEAWFKIRGNRTCEICGSTAENIVGINEAEQTEQWNEADENAATIGGAHQSPEIRHFWQGHRFLNFLLACMVFAFVISWLFHFNVPS